MYWKAALSEYYWHIITVIIMPIKRSTFSDFIKTFKSSSPKKTTEIHSIWETLNPKKNVVKLERLCFYLPENYYTRQ